MKESELLLSFSLVRHWDGLLDPVYEEGYLAPSQYSPPYPENPYRFPQALELKRQKIACKEGRLAHEEMVELRRLNARFAKTKWERWSKGNYYRWCVENA